MQEADSYLLKRHISQRAAQGMLHAENLPSAAVSSCRWHEACLRTQSNHVTGRSHPSEEAAANDAWRMFRKLNKLPWVDPPPLVPITRHPEPATQEQHTPLRPHASAQPATPISTSQGLPRNPSSPESHGRPGPAPLPAGAPAHPRNTSTAAAPQQQPPPPTPRIHSSPAPAAAVASQRLPGTSQPWPTRPSGALAPHTDVSGALKRGRAAVDEGGARGSAGRARGPQSGPASW